MHIKTLIVDDEPLAREGLANYIEKINFINLVGVAEDSIQANEMLKRKNIDLLFLDIEMPGLSGIEFLKSISSPPMVIFTTAYQEFALEGYELDILDYLLKPITFERFEHSVNKAKSYFELRSAAGKNKLQQVNADYFFVKCSNKYEKIYLKDIIYAEGLQNYSIIQTSSQRYITLLNLGHIENYLPSNDFLRVQKSFIIAIDKINFIEGNEIDVGICKIPISRTNKEKILSQILSNRLIKK